MAFDVGELVATIKAAGLQAFQQGLTGTEQSFRRTGATAQKSMDAVEQSTKGATAAVKQQGTEAAAAGTKGAAAARQQKAATDASTASTQKQATTSRQAGTAAAEAGAKGAKAGKDTADAADKARAKLEKQAQAGREVGTVLTAAGAAALAAFTGAAVSSASLDQRLAQLRSLGQYSAAQMDVAKEAALTAGQQYGLTADQVADAQIELQKAGTGLQQQLGGALPGALTLAASGQLDVAEATSIAVTAMTQFHLQADQTAHVADLLAAGSDKALGSVGDLGMALKQGGLVASQYGWSLEETVGTLSAFANAGLIGSDAGTSLKTALLQLATPTQQQAALMKQYNLQLYDSQGHFVSASNLAGQLSKSFATTDEQSRNMALGVLFGSDAVRAANVLFNEGSAGIQKWTKEVNDSGFAAEQAAGKQDSLAGDAQKLASAFQNDLIRAGQAVTPLLRLVTQATTGLLEVVEDVPEPVLAAGTALTAIGGAALVGGGGFLIMLPRILDTVQAVRTLTPVVTAAAARVPVLGAGLKAASYTATGFRSAIGSAASFLAGPWGLALAGAGLALSIYKAAVDAAKASTETVDAAVKSSSVSIDGLIKTAAQGQNMNLMIFGGYDAEAHVLDNIQGKLDSLSKFRAPEWLRNFGDTDLAVFQNTLNDTGESLARVAATDGPAAAKAFGELAAKTDGSDRQLKSLLDSMPAYSQYLQTQAVLAGSLTGKENDEQRAKVLLAEATKEATSAGNDQAATAQAQAAAIGQIQGSAAAASDDVKDLANQIKGLGSATLDARAAQRDLEQAVDDAAKQFGKGSHSLDISTQAGRDNQAAMDKIAQAATNAASATYAQTGSIDKATESMRLSRDEFVKSVKPILGSKAAADKLADSLGLIPADVQSLVTVKTQTAEEALRSLVHQIENVPDYFYVTPRIQAPAGTPGSGDGTFLLKGNRAAGGPITGGQMGKDSVPIMAMPGEHMVTTREVQAVGGQQGMYRVRAAMRAGTLSGYARGGAIGDAQSAREQADRDVAKLADQIKRANDRLKAAKRAASRAEKAYKRAQDAQAGIYGKGTGDAKHQATLTTRQAKKDADAAAAKVKTAQKTLDDLKDDRKDAQDRAKAQSDRRTQLTQDSQDFRIGLSRGNYVDASSPFAAVDQALQMSRDSNFTAAQRKTLNSTVGTANTQLVKLTQAQKANDDAIQAQTKSLQEATDASDAAAQASQKAGDALQQLKDSAKSMADGIAQTIRGFFSLGATIQEEQSTQTSITHNAGTAAAYDEKVTTVTPGGTTVAGIRQSVERAASSMATFTAQLQQLQQKGYSTAIIQDVANLGVEQGTQVADALLRGTGDDVAAINAGYVSMASASSAGGQFVADQVYGGQISQAQQDANTAAQVAAAKAQAAADAQKQLDTLNANTASINAQIENAQRSVVDAITRALGQSGSASKKAADGLFREAQIQPGGANILWAEPETGGESYIPHAASKRNRSTQILAATARKFGMVLLPMADGGMLGGVGGGTDARQYAGGDTYQFHGTWLGRPEDAMRAARREADARKARAVANAGLRRVNP